MKALHFDGNRKIHVENVPDPAPKDGQVLVRVLHSGVCQTELRYYLGEGASGILGHEVVGRIEEIGPGVRAFGRGDAVVCYPSLPCGNCTVCRSGHANVCPNRKSIRGGFAEYMAADARYFLPLPGDFLNACGTLLYDIFGMMYRGMAPLGIGPDSCTAIVGLQPYGLGGLAIARQLGAWRVVAIDSSRYRRRLAEALGADITIDSKAPDLSAVAADATGGDGFSEIVECDEPSVPIDELFAWVRNGGHVCLMGHTNRALSLNPNWITTREVKVTGSPRCLPEEFPEVFQIARKCTNKASIITHEPRLEEASAALADYAAGNTGKIAFDLT